MVAKFCFALCVFSLISCATVNFDYPKEPSFSITHTSDTRLGKQLGGQGDAKMAGQSGFHLLSDGVDAFAARLVLAEKAERSIDAQYYLITNDVIGKLFIAALLRAADRGVHVRLLLDDIQTRGYDSAMLALDSLENFEVRVFNPFANRERRLLDLPQFARLNRRMHNKSFTVDAQVSVVGGRNIASEYFGAREDVNFGDLDVAAIGPVVGDVSRMFDVYWNSWASLPVAAFAKASKNQERALHALRKNLAKTVEQNKNKIYIEALKQDYLHYLQFDSVDLTWADYQLAYDAPEKAIKSKADKAHNITSQLAAAVASAEKELIIISPYFVPLKAGEVLFQELVDRNIAVTVLTNSLAANNHSIVHAGYASSRKRLLKMGVKIYEVKAGGIRPEYKRVGHENSRSTLHTKAFLVDRKKVFIGSFNWDPRSVNLNTELGVIIDSEKIGAQLTEGLQQKLNSRSYKLELDENENLLWLEQTETAIKEYRREPDTSWWQRFYVKLFQLLPIKSQL